MELLELSQIIFNVTLSITATIIGVTILIFIDRTFKAIKAVENFFITLDEKTQGVYRNVNLLLEGIPNSRFTLRYTPWVFSSNVIKKFSTALMALNVLSIKIKIVTPIMVAVMESVTLKIICDNSSSSIY